VRSIAIGVLVAIASTCQASAGRPVRVSVVGGLHAAVVGHSWTVRLRVRPASFRGPVHVSATGPRAVRARVTGGHGSYRARLVFPRAGRWMLVARAGSTRTRLGTVRVRRLPPQPLAFSEPTSIDLEPAGTLLIVENNPGSLLRVDPRSGHVTALVPSVNRPYAVVRAPSGTVFLTSGNLLVRFSAGSLATAARADSDIGPVAVARNGDVFYATSTRVFRLPGGSGPPVRVAGTGVAGGAGDGGPAVDAQVSSPHGLALGADGALLIGDSGNDRVRRIDPATGVMTALASIAVPHGIDVAADGTIYVVEAESRRIVHLSAGGSRLGLVGPAFQLPYDVEVAPGGAVYVLEAGPLGRVRRVAPDGTVTTVSRPR
jgi:sugar lactone lactonase YvrE